LYRIAPRWQKRTGVKGGVHWDAVLVEAVRVDGNPRQRYVGRLCGIGQQALDGPYRVAVCCGFWDHVTDRLYGLGVAPEAHARIVATLACKSRSLPARSTSPATAARMNSLDLNSTAGQPIRSMTYPI
jgi:hypothetical protein